MIRGVCIRDRNDNILEYYAKNNGLCIVYGAGIWGRAFAKEQMVKIDYFCDRQAKQIHDVEGIPVVEREELQSLVVNYGRRATVIVCAGYKNNIVTSIYNDLMKLDMDVDVFDLFENYAFFSHRSFVLDGKSYELFEHSYNCGYVTARMTERSVELALASEYLQECSGSVIEVGAVTPYYFYNEKITDIIDPTDSHCRVTLGKSLFECELKQKNVLSISTVEHIGTHDYGMSEEKNVIDAIKKIIDEASTFLITAPLGYNVLLDEWVRANRGSFMIRILKRGINNHWTEIDPQEYDNITYTPLWANGLLIIRK